MNRFRLRKTAAVALLLFSALSASALTIGRMRGAAWLGQPLDASVQVQIEGEQGLAALCFEAEVFHGDSRQDAGRVRVTAEGGPQAQTAQVRIQSSAVVDEPVVTVYVRETCVSKTSRRFVLLSEIPPEAPLASTPPSVPVAAPKAAETRAAAPLAGEAAPPQRVQPRPPRPASAPAAPKATPSATPPLKAGGGKSGASGKPVSAPQPVTTKPKLKLDPVESLSDRVAQLEVAAAQASQPAPASAAEAQRLQKLEQSLQSLLALSARNERGMAELRERLLQAEAEKYSNGLVYGLAGLLLAALGGLAYFWRRQRQTQSAGEAAWWDENERTPPSAVVTSLSPSAPAAAAAAVPVTAAAAAAAASVTALAATETAPEGVFVPAPLAVPPAAASAPEAQAPVEIDLDDLLAVGAESSAAPPDMNAVAGVDEIPVVDFPSLPQVEQPGAAAEQAAGAAMPEFPAAGEVSIDISHLSLSPVEQTRPEESSSAPLLDFDLPGLDKPGAASPAGPDKDDPPAKT